MCNLYSLTRAREAMLRLIRVSDNRAAAIELTPANLPATSPSCSTGSTAVPCRRGLEPLTRFVSNVPDPKRRTEDFIHA